MSAYIAEEFSDAEADVLRRYFTNLDQPVFALVNLPEVVKGALFARYSRSSKSLRRLFLDEFVGDLDIEGDVTIDATVGLERAEELYNRVFFEYGDDSVAQLGGVHLACEQASNLLTKVLEWGRLMSYLEQSTRYIAYDTRLGGRYRYFRPPSILKSELGTRYVAEMDRMFSAYSALIPTMTDFYREQTPKSAADSDFVYRQAIKAKALDAIRGMLPAASISNLGIYGTGQAYEALLLRMRAHPLPEARSYSDLMLEELRKVIPFIPSSGGPRGPRRGDQQIRRDESRRDGRDRRSGVRQRRHRTGPTGAVARLRSRRGDQSRRGGPLPAHVTSRRTDPATRSRRWGSRSDCRSCGPTPASATTDGIGQVEHSSVPSIGSTCSPTMARSVTCNATA